jgi:mediator of replication checkpoint protein 1
VSHIKILSVYLRCNFYDREEWQTVGTKPMKRQLSSSDPIIPFTSSPANASSSANSVALPFRSTGLLAPPFKSLPLRRQSEPLDSTRLAGNPEIIPSLDDDSDEDLPDVKDLLEDEKKKQKANQLAEMKLQILARQEAENHLGNNNDDDDELVIESDMHAVADEEAGDRRVQHAKHIRPSEGRKRQLMLGGIGTLKADKGFKVLGRVKKNPFDVLKENAKPVFRSRGKQGKDESIGLTAAQLNRLMIESAERERAEIDRQKEDEWTRRGGKVVRDAAVSEGPSGDWTLFLENARQAAEKNAVDEVEASENSDQDWVPEMRGSASPEPVDAGSGDDDGVASEAEVAMDVLTDREEVEAEDREGSRPRRPRRLVPHRAVLDSDEDDDSENVRPRQSKPSFGQVLVPDTSFAETMLPLSRMPGMMHRGSLSSFDEPTEDENDKENNTQLMFDKSEDKENKAVVRYSPLPSRPALGSRTGSLFGLEERTRRTLSMSPSRIELSDDDHDQADNSLDKARKPLKELRDDDDPFAFSPSVSSFVTRLQRPNPSGLAPSSASFGNKNPLGSSLFLGEDNEDKSPITKSGLQPGFSDIFKSRSSPPVVSFKPSGTSGFSQWSEDYVRTPPDHTSRKLILCRTTLDLINYENLWAMWRICH